MYYNRGLADYGDGREMPPKRQRMMDQGPSYYGGLAGPSFMYNAPPYAAYANQPPPFPVVKLRGLPFDCTETDVAEFFHGLDIVDVVLVHKGTHFTGEAYCLLGYPMQVDFALQRNRQNIGRRYIEVFRSKRHDYYRAIANEVSDSHSGSSSHRSTRARSYDEANDLAEHTGILRMRGLPYSATKEGILDFFKNFALSEDKIHITYNSEGRPSGEAFVNFSDPDQSRAAMSKDRMTLGNRYVELFASNHQEMTEAVARGRARSNDEEQAAHTGVLRMRGLPFSAGKEDISDFFKEFLVSEESIHVIFSYDGRPTGEAYVEFAGPRESEAAMAKNRKMLGSRYIELFPSTRQELNEALAKGSSVLRYVRRCGARHDF
ncbi:hypothetical protein V2J09_018499 [Rumex salicifolius]